MSLTPIDALLGSGPEPPRCKIVSADIAVHWWHPDRKPGDLCLCGTLPFTEPDASLIHSISDKE